MDIAKYIGAIYHRDSETDSDNYIAFSFGSTLEELYDKLKKIKTPGYTENIKTFEIGIDVLESLHTDLLAEKHFFYDCSFWCEDELDSLLRLNFVTKTLCCYAL